NLARDGGDGHPSTIARSYPFNEVTVHRRALSGPVPDGIVERRTGREDRPERTPGMGDLGIMPSARGCATLRRAQRRSRREFLRVGGLGWLGLGLPTLLQGRALSAVPPDGSFGRAKACILLFMWGGPAPHDSWDLKPEAPEQFRGEFRPIATEVP